MAKVITARLDHDIDKDLALIAKTEHLDRSTVMRRLLSNGRAEWRKDRAVEK
jgi:predicted transcriptional regulator